MRANCHRNLWTDYLRSLKFDKQEWLMLSTHCIEHPILEYSMERILAGFYATDPSLTRWTPDAAPCWVMNLI